MRKLQSRLQEEPSMEHKPHVHSWKKEQVQHLEQLFKTYPNIAVANLEGLPARTYQIVRKQLRGKVEFIMTRKDFMIKALEQIKPKNHEQLLKHLTGVPALLFTHEDPFRLYKLVDKSKTDAFAKPGQIAPYDLGIDEGPTKFTPGPMIAEFGQMGIKTEVKEGKISVRTAKIIVEGGKAITDKVAAFLQKMEIRPMKIGMNIALVYEKGEIIPKSVLAVDESQYIQAITQAARDSIGLALHIGYATPETIKMLLSKADAQARSVAREGKLLTPETAKEALAEAEAQAANVQQAAGLK
ncbi:MAG TPA: 50S ribosomal protein L10 [Candidatus Nanoarchaeia archaeon]|nr:50S ribosomal protein L10 [Candidatus Nanoarchaeia archaeon]